MKNIYLFIHANSTEGINIIKKNLVNEKEILPYLEDIYNSEKDFFDNKNTFGKFHPFTTVKFISELNTCIYIYYIPKMFDLNTCALVENEETKIKILKLKEKFKKFYIKCNTLYNQHNFLTSNISNSNETLNFIELDFDYQILLKIKKNLLNLNSKEIETIIYSEFLEGVIEEQLNKFNHNKNIFIQKNYVKNEKLFNSINSFLKLKFNHLYLSFLNNHKNVFPICLKIYNLIKEIKKISEYDNNQYFYSKNELFKLLKNKRFLDFYIENKKLFLNLEQLLLNNIGLDKDFFKRQTLQMDKIWEIYVEKHLQSLGLFFEKQHENIFQKISIGNTIVYKKLRPDYLGDFVGDAKYKNVTFEYLNSDYYSSDFNKLIRDCVVYRKKHGVFFFPKKENTNHNYIVNNDHGLEDFTIEIKEIEFIY